MESFVFEQQVVFRFDFLYGFKPKGSVSQGGARGQNLEHLRIFFFILWIPLYLNYRFFLMLTFSL